MAITIITMCDSFSEYVLHVGSGSSIHVAAPVAGVIVAVVLVVVIVIILILLLR